MGPASIISSHSPFSAFGKKYIEQLRLSDIEMVQMIMNKKPHVTRKGG